MKKLLKPYKHLIALFCVIVAALCIVNIIPSLAASPERAFGTFLMTVGCWQLSQFAMSKRSGVCYNSVLTPEQVKEFGEILKELGDYKTVLPQLRELVPGLKDLGSVEGGFAVLKTLPKVLKDQGEELTKLKGQITEAQRALLQQRNLSSSRTRGRMSDAGAACLGAMFVRYCEKNNKLEELAPDPMWRKALLAEARTYLGVKEDKVLSSSDIPLPTMYASEIRDLIAEYGVLRRVMTGWPLSGGTDAPPRGKTRFGLTKVAQAAQIGEKSLQIEFASLEPHKVGGIIYTPRELRDGSIVAMGQYIARLAAVAAAQIEDETGFLADGTATYESIKGVAKIALDNNKTRALATAKTAPSDAVVADFRALLALVNSRVRGSGSWFLNNTWEAYLPELNTQANQYTFRYDNSGRALLLGRPIEWTEVLQGYQDMAAPSAIIAVYGDLSYWWFGTRPGGLRIDESADFKFDYDLIATRMLEEFDFDYMATDAAATIKTGAGA